MDSAGVGSDPDEPSYESEPDRIHSNLTSKGHVQIRCRTRKGRIRPSIDSARSGPDPDETAYDSDADESRSHSGPSGPSTGPGSDPECTDKAVRTDFRAVGLRD